MTSAIAARRGFLAGLTALLVAVTGAIGHAEDVAQTPPAGVPMMLGARIVGDNQRVRFVADLSQKVTATVFTLSDPDRIVVDLPEVRFALPELAGTTGRGLIKAFRYGLISPGKSRIVIDLAGPTLIDKSFVIDPAQGQPARLVIDAVPTTTAKFLAATRAYKEQQVAAAASTAPAGPETATPDHGDKPVIVIDPGHGGIDTGAHGPDGVLEKNVTLAFGKTLGKLLEASGRYRVIYTRTDDSYIALGERVVIARRANADLFVSIHANSFPGNSVRGAIVYTASDKASDAMAASLANAENQSDALAGVDVNAADSGSVKDILADLTLRETRNFGVVFARNLVKELGKTTRMFKVPHQEAAFKVLEAPDVPSALVELGYLTNPNDAKLMTTDAWQEKTAGSIVSAIDDYFRTRVAGRTAN
jgi:N-acetylmuramoyl-L-alanine amidase